MMVLHPGDEVAVMPRDGTKPVDVLSVLAVSHVGELFVQMNGRLYAVLDGRSLDRTARTLSRQPRNISPRLPNEPSRGGGAIGPDAQQP